MTTRGYLYSSDGDTGYSYDGETWTKLLPLPLHLCNCSTCECRDADDCATKGCACCGDAA